MHDNDEKGNWAPVDPVRAGLAGQCPRCGQGTLFSGLLTVTRACSSCKLDYGFADAGDGPAVFVILIIGFIVVGLALWLEVTRDPPLWVHFLLWVPLIIVLSLVALRLIKGLLIVFQYRNKAAEGRLDKGR